MIDNEHECANSKYTTQVYVKGKVFNSLEEALEYERKWLDEPVDIEAFLFFLHARLREARMNLDINPNFSNRVLFRLLEQQVQAMLYEGSVFE